MKSIKITSHACSGIAMGWSKPGEATCSGLFRWHTSQFRTNLVISTFKDGQKKVLSALLIVAVMPECPPSALE